MTEIDFVDDLEMTRKDGLQHADWPPLKGFRQNGVVGVGTSAGSDIPSLILSRTVRRNRQYEL